MRFSGFALYFAVTLLEAALPRSVFRYRSISGLRHTLHLLSRPSLLFRQNDSEDFISPHLGQRFIPSPSFTVQGSEVAALRLAHERLAAPRMAPLSDRVVHFRCSN